MARLMKASLDAGFCSSCLLSRRKRLSQPTVRATRRRATTMNPRCTCPPGPNPPDSTPALGCASRPLAVTCFRAKHCVNALQPPRHATAGSNSRGIERER
jgi:hypothetical protein